MEDWSFVCSFVSHWLHCCLVGHLPCCECVLLVDWALMCDMPFLCVQTDWPLFKLVQKMMSLWVFRSWYSVKLLALDIGTVRNRWCAPVQNMYTAFGLFLYKQMWLLWLCYIDQYLVQWCCFCVCDCALQPSACWFFLDEVMFSFVLTGQQEHVKYRWQSSVWRGQTQRRIIRLIFSILQSGSCLVLDGCPTGKNCILPNTSEQPLNRHQICQLIGRIPLWSSLCSTNNNNKLLKKLFFLWKWNWV